MTSNAEFGSGAKIYNVNDGSVGTVVSKNYVKGEWFYVMIINGQRRVRSTIGWALYPEVPEDKIS